MTDIYTRLDAIVRPHLRFLAPGQPLTPETPLGEAGLDSMASISLIVELEESLGISIPDELLTENTFANLENLRHLVESVPAAV